MINNPAAWGARDVVLKSSAPTICDLADRQGVIVGCQRRLRVNTTAVTRWHQRCNRKAGLTLTRLEIKWHLNISIRFLAGLVRWSYRGRFGIHEIIV